MIPRASNGAAMSESFSLCTAIAETTLPCSFRSMTSKSAVISSGGYGNAFSTWMRTISANSPSSTVGKRSRCASTAFTGNARTTFVVPLSNGTVSSSEATPLTAHEPLCPFARTTFQPCAAGTKNTGRVSASILNLLPIDQLRNVPALAHDHLHGARDVAGAANTGNPHDLIFEGDERRKLFELLGREPERGANLLEALERTVVVRPLGGVRSGAQLEKRIHQLVVHSGQREKQVS